MMHDAKPRVRLEDMFRTHNEMIWRTLRRRGMTAETAADMTQQAFLIAAERLDDIRPGCERAFLMETALRLAHTAHRKTARCQLQDDMDAHVDPSMHVEELTDRRRAIALMDRALAELEPELNEVFVLFELEGFSTPEIAEMIHVPLGTAASRLRRAREAFRAAAVRLERVINVRCGNG